ERSGAVYRVDPEAAALEVAARGERDGEPEDRGLQLRLGDELADLGTAGLAVGACLGDRPDDDLRPHEGRGAEELAVTLVSLRVGLDDRVARGDREERVVRARDLPRARREQAVRAEQLDVTLARGLQLLPEGLRLRDELPRDVDDLRVARDLRDLGREVRVGLRDRVAGDGDALGRSARRHGSPQ